jgi:hypothetical protein
MASDRAATARIVGLDVVGPLLLYRICRSAGVAQVWSLVISGCSPGLGVLIDYARWRTLEVVGAIVLTGITFSVVLALISGSPKAVLLEAAATTAGFGLLCLISLLSRRPLMFYFVQAFRGGRHSEEGVGMNEAYDVYPQTRHYFRTITVVWGVANLIQAAVLAVIVQLVSTGVALVFNKTVPWIGFAILFVWTYRWGMRMRAEVTALEEANA